MGSWAPSETKPYAANGFTYRTFAFPKLRQNGDYSVPVVAIGFAVPKKASNAVAAEKFIAYFVSKSQIQGISTTALNVTPRTDISVPKQLAEVKKLLATHAISVRLDGVDADFPDFDAKVMQPLNQDLLRGVISAKQFISKISSQQAQYWKVHG
jgi:ABC-type glycerol-3-phosphate transport system substrate-binding protein